MRIFSKRILIIFASLFFSLLLTEGVLRSAELVASKNLFGLKPTRTTVSWLSKQGIGKFLLTPNTSGWFVTPTHEYANKVTTNSEGLYDTNHQIEKPTNTYRILFLGDSFVESLQTPLNKTFFKIVEDNLNSQNLDKKVEAISIGLGDTGTAQQYIALKEIGLKYKPDLVVLMFLTANDFKNNSLTLQNDPYRPYFTLTDDNTLEQIQPQNFPQSPFKDYLKKFRIVELILTFRQSLQQRLANSNVDYPLDYHVYDKNYSKAYRDSIKVTESLFLDMKKTVEENNGKFLIITLASNEQVNPGVITDIRKTYPKFNDMNIDLEKPDKEIADFCKINNLDCLSMLHYFKEYIKTHPNTPTHYKYDGHWNELGTSLTSNFLLQHLPSYTKPKKNVN